MVEMATLEQREVFTHDQLDTTQQSIRVISIDSELSPEGFVQCSIRHTNIDAHYNCLSYRWGSLDLSHTLIIDGKRLSINQSLHDFLTKIRTFTYREPDQIHASYHLRDNLWIDAICIDQDSELEKIHQVAQMGKIYMKATKVVMWLGNNREISSDMLPKTTFRENFGFVWHNKYWTRAWIAQEVILAKDPVLMIANHLISFPDFVKEYINSEWLSRRSARLEQFQNDEWLSRRSDWLERSSETDLRSTDMYGVLRAWIKWGAYLGYTIKPGITQWLNKLQHVSCTLIHDRIFSLLELCEEGRRIPVDYSMPRSELIYRVLNARDHGVCLCEIFLLNHLLWVQYETINTSGTCVYAQWKPDPSGRVCHSIVTEEKAKLWSGLKTMINGVPTMVVQVPLQKLGSREIVGLCNGAITSKVRIPVQLAHGRVHDWQLVSEDGKVEEPHANFAEVRLETQYAPSNSKEAEFLKFSVSY
jgi:hypothetical protein